MVRDMTTGNSAKQLLMFSLPLLVGTVFQQFYNMVDSIIVGRYVGMQAFAAVGSTGSITFFVLGLFIVPVFGFAAVCFAHPVAWIMAIVLLLPLYIVAMRRLRRETPVLMANV